MSTLKILDPNPFGSPAILFLHGLGASGESWMYQLTAFSNAGFRPLAPDLPGFGSSPYDGRGWTIQQISRQVADCVRNLEINRFHVVGLSLGGVIAQQLVRDFPNHVCKLVLVSTFSVLRPVNASEFFYYLRRLMAISLLGLSAQARVVAARVFPKPDQMELRNMLFTSITLADKRAYRSAMHCLSLFDSRGWLHLIQTPTLILTGELDNTVSSKRQKELAERIPGARHIIFSNAGHAVNIEKPDEFNHTVLEFLQ